MQERFLLGIGPVSPTKYYGHTSVGRYRIILFIQVGEIALFTEVKFGWATGDFCQFSYNVLFLIFVIDILGVVVLIPA